MYYEFLTNSLGRNGGHLTPHAFAHFTSLSKLFGQEDAIRSLELERYTSSEIRKILQGSNKVDDVDLVSDGRVILLFSKQEEELTRAEFEAAKAAGINLSDVEWLTKDETEEVLSIVISTHKPAYNLIDFVEIWCALPISEDSREQCLATRTRQPPLQPR